MSKEYNANSPRESLGTTLCSSLSVMAASAACVLGAASMLAVSVPDGGGFGGGVPFGTPASKQGTHATGKAPL